MIDLWVVSQKILVRAFNREEEDREDQDDGEGEIEKIPGDW